ncbi:MAG: hypothetical protein ABFD50_09430 [Smithella sp.]
MLASLKLIDLVEKNAEEIAKQWVVEVKKNKRTLSYQNIPSEKLIPRAVEFYHELRRMLMSASSYEESQAYLLKYAKTCFDDNIPLHEAIYALAMMRRQMWLFAEFQVTFNTVVERQSAIDSVTRVIRMMDYAVYTITKNYQEFKKKS